jgi:predicted ATPase/transcriptional regulator with XRE-family HTH domain
MPDQNGAPIHQRLSDAKNPDPEAGEDALPFGALLRQLREAARLTQAELAAAANLSVPTISALERGIRATPHMETARLLVTALRLSPDDRDRFETAFRQQRRPRRRPPAAPAIAALPPSLPVPAAPVLGRAGEIAAVERLISGPGRPIVTITGPGGVGKTRLAQELALRRAFAGDPVCWVSLADELDPAGVLAAIARDAGVPSAGASPLLDRLVTAFGEKPGLLVLDNFERLLAAAPDVAALRAAAPHLAILVTSRVRLRLPDEAVVVAPPLPVPGEDLDADPASLLANAAVALFRRGLDAPAGVPLDACARVVRLVDGLPLAIELAAAQCQTLPPATVAELLEQAGHDLLVLGSPGAPERQQTMDAAIAWSADLLPDPARRLFPMLSCFRGGFTVEAVAAVAADLGEADLVRGIGLLADAHLVQPAAGDHARAASRLAMLEPIRQFARARLRDSGREWAARSTHARWFLGRAIMLGQEVTGSNPIPALNALADDLANLRAALEFAAETGASDPALLDAALAAAGLNWRFWEARASMPMARSLIERLFAAASAAGLPPTLAQADAAYVAGYFAVLMNDAAGADRHLRRLRALAAALDSSEHRSLALQVEAGILVDQPTMACESIDLYRRARAIAGDDRRFAWWAATLLLGIQLLQQGDPAGALRLLDEAAAAARVEGRALDLPVVLAQSGLAAIEAGDFDAARDRLREAARLATRFEVANVAVLAALGLARVASLSEDVPAYPDAARLLGSANAITARSGHGYGEWWDRAIAECRAVLEAELGARRTTALFTAGRRMTPAEIIWGGHPASRREGRAARSSGEAR